MGLVSLTSLCGKNENKEKKEEKQLNEVIEDDDKEVNDEKLRRMIEIQTKEIKRILETIHLENVQSVGTKSFDEDKNKLSEVLKKVLQLLSRKIINFNLEFELKDAIKWNMLIRDAKDIVENRNNEMFSKITLIIVYRISEILFKTFFSNQIYGRNYYQTFN